MWMKRSAVLVWLLATAVAGVVACGGQNKKSAGETSPAPAVETQTTAASTGQGTLTGKVKYKGSAPSHRAINFGAERQCAVLHDKPVYYEDVVVNANGTLRDVLVYVKETIEGDFQPPGEPVVVDQSGCVFVPHVVAVMAGQPVEFRNNDPLLHNVRVTSKQGQTFNIAQPLQGMTHTKTFTKPEVGIPLRCDVHFWMSGFVHVMPHPFFALTAEEGTFVIPDLPAGTYTLEAWHGKLGTQQVQVTIKGGETKSVEFEFGKATS